MIGIRREWVLCALVGGLTAIRADAAQNDRFDGNWLVTVSCPNYSDALGYSFEVPSTVQHGAFHGERMHDGEAGHLVIDGTISSDGHAELYAKGLIGAKQFAVGQRPKGTEYGYHIAATFDGSKGIGHRIEGRPCDLNFIKQSG